MSDQPKNAPPGYEESFVVDGQLALPYRYFAGAVGSKFLIALRDEQKILGQRHPKTGKTFIPPRQTDERDFTDLTKAWVELGKEGTVTAFTVIRYQEPYQPLPPPYVLGLVRLDGADTPLAHLVAGCEPEAVRVGMRVKAVFADQREGSILDIKWFEPS